MNVDNNNSDDDKMDFSFSVICQGNTAKKMKLIREKLSPIPTPTATTITDNSIKNHLLQCRIGRDRLGARRQKKVVVRRSRSQRKMKENEEKTKRYGRFFEEGVFSFCDQKNEFELDTNMKIDECNEFKRFSKLKCLTNSNSNKAVIREQNTTLEKFEKLRFDGGEIGIYCQLLPTIVEDTEESDENEIEEEPYYWNEISFPEDFYQQSGSEGYVLMYSNTDDRQHLYECVDQLGDEH